MKLCDQDVVTCYEKKKKSLLQNQEASPSDRAWLCSGFPPYPQKMQIMWYSSVCLRLFILKPPIVGPGVQDNIGLRQSQSTKKKNKISKFGTLAFNQTLTLFSVLHMCDWMFFLSSAKDSLKNWVIHQGIIEILGWI